MKGYDVWMLFQKKVDRAFNWLKEKNRSRNGENVDNNDNKDMCERSENDNKLELEKHDFAAMIIAALLVFAPILILLFIIILIVS